jgi:hypothetical protein
MKFEDDFVAELKAGMWTSLKALAVIAALVLLAVWLFGCSTRAISITPGCVNATSTALLYCPEATVIRVVDGNRTVDMLGEASGVGAVVTGLGNNAVEVMRP